MGKLGIIGCGNLGSAIARGLVGTGVMSGSDIAVVDNSKEKVKVLENQLGVVGQDNLSSLLSFLTTNPSILIIAVKPYVVKTLLSQIKAAQSDISNFVFLSVAAGVKVSQITEVLGPQSRIVRVMPNVACLVGSGMSVIYSENSSDAELAKDIFSATGKAEIVESEDLVEIATGLTAGGPAFVFAMIEAMADGGVKMGLSRQRALEFASQTVLGAAKMVIETGEHPEVLKDQVASPGGTTIAGLHELERNAFRGTVISAIEASVNRARSDLSKK